MANNRPTIFSRLNNLLSGRNEIPAEFQKSTDLLTANVPDKVLFSTNDKEEYQNKLQQLRQQKLLSYQWIKAGADTAMDNLAGYTATKLMYRDSDLMDGMPEIGAALDIYTEEACCLRSDGQMLNIYSKSTRVKSVLEDLFVNRLNVHVMLPMFAREMCKYGNAFALLNINEKEGIMGWMKLPVYELDRIESGSNSPYTNSALVTNSENMKPNEVRFLWTGHNENVPYYDWQIAHFRMLQDSFFLPYGTSCLHKARRAWRMWSMMEDAMLIYRLDKSIERRIFKIYVGGIDDQDVKAYVQQVANEFKRTPIIDPQTGQVDLRKNFMDVSTDYFIPVRNESAPNPIETLQGAQNQTSMDDIEYMKHKVLAALRIPKTFLNFQEPQGKGQNLAYMDVRFARFVNRIQQFLLMELNKIAMIHLYLIGMTDELSNFTITLNNPTNQVESQELENLGKRVQLVGQVLADPGIGMPIYSLHKALKEIMKMSDAQIKDMLNEIRLEKAMAAELANTQTIIKKTGIFDKVDRIYGDYDAMNAPQQGGAPQEGGDAGGAGGGMPMMDMGGGEDMSGGGEMDMGEDAMAADAGGADMGGAEAAPMENVNRYNKPIITELKKKAAKSFTEKYLTMLEENDKKENGDFDEAFDYEVKSNSITERVENLMDKIDELIAPKTTDEKIDQEVLKDDEDAE